jgi:hypothetical protein
VAKPPVATVAGLFDSAAQAATMEAPARAALGPDGDTSPGEFHQVGNALFYRATSGVLKDAKPVYDAWIDGAVSVVVLGEESSGRTLMFTAVWRVTGEEDEARATSLEAYLDTALMFSLRPPWEADDAGPAVSADEATARRTLHRIQEAEREDLAAQMLGPFATVRAIWMGLTASLDDRDWRKQFAERHEERIETLGALARGLAEDDPTLDSEILLLYVSHQDEIGRIAFEDVPPSNPFAEDAEEWSPYETEAARHLRERLGARPRPNEDAAPGDPYDPEMLFLRDTGWVQRSDEEIGVQVYLADPAASAPAILDYVCGGEVAEVTYGFSEGGA